MKKLLFLKGFLKNWREVGSPVPSSPYVAKKICKLIDFSRIRSLVELGPGTGVITQEILRSLQADARLIVFEINKDYCDELRSSPDSRLTIHNVSAFRIHTVLREKVDCVVSAIPIATLSKAEFRRFYAAVTEVLEPGGVFIQIQLSPQYYRTLKHFFREVRIDFTCRNTPPAFVYRCRWPAIGALHQDLVSAAWLRNMATFR
jgi:phospholipid N-methyltransferase